MCGGGGGGGGGYTNLSIMLCLQGMMRSDIMSVCVSVQYLELMSTSNLALRGNCKIVARYVYAKLNIDYDAYTATLGVP